MKEKKKNRQLRFLKIILYTIPFILGVTGLAVIEKHSILDSIFSVINMYVLNYGDEPANGFIEAARWTAPLVTAGGIVSVIYILRLRIHNFVVYHKGNSVAVFGKPDVQKVLMEQLGKRGLLIDSDFVLADSYILADEEKKNLAFFNEHEDELKNHKIYMESKFLQAQFSPSAEITLFSEEETAARNYWLKYPVFRSVLEKGYQYQIVMIGYGKLGDEVLLSALQTNIFHPDQHLVYHVFGAEEQMMSMRSSMQKLEDEVLFHKEMWHENMKIVNDADLILVLCQENQIQTLANLLSMSTNQNIYVFSNYSMNRIIQNRPEVTFYDWHKEGLKIENIMNEENIANAKELNYNYVLNGRKNDNLEVVYNKTERDNAWKELDAFTRYSNISAANYQAMRLHMVEVLGYSKDVDEITDDKLQFLSELEHIRWCRYHFINNWHYGKPESGQKDKIRRIHSDLIPYSELPEEEKVKDLENIRILLKG